MKIKAFFIALLLATFSTSASAKVTIWEYSFTSESPKELIAGHGASIFQIDGNSFNGPLDSQEDLRLRLRFTIDGTSVTGTLTPEGYTGKPIQVTGTLTNIAVTGKYKCRQVIQLSNEFHTVFLRRLEASCSS